MVNLPDYAELHCQSYFSFLKGASAPEALIERANALGYRALAITDECSVAGVVRAYAEARGKPLQLIVGSTFTVSSQDSRQDQNQHTWRLTLLAEDRNGYSQLCELISRARARAPKGSYRMFVSDLDDLPNCLAIALPPPANSLQQLAHALSTLTPRFATRLWVGQSLLLHNSQSTWRGQIETLADRYGLPCVAIGQVLMARRSEKPLQDVVSAIGLGRQVKDCGFALAPNAEQHLRSRLRLAQIYPAPWLEATLDIAQRCQFTLSSLRYEYPEEIVPAGQTPDAYLQEQTWRGAHWRYPNGTSDTVRRQIAHELTLIAELGYACYFLTVYDVVRFARQAGILCQGRGSAANSAVCYCLGITEVDPESGNLLFERFISRERNEPPDIDVDFEHQRREQVIQYIYDRYGRHRAALTAVAITYRPRSALRDVGKALGIAPSVIDHVARSVAWWERSQAIDTLHERLPTIIDPKVVSHWIALSKALIGSVRHLSQHPGGFVLSQHRLSSLVPIEPASMPGRSVVQWDKDDLDTLGLMKVDVLALGMLSVIRRAMAYTAWRRGLSQFSMQDIARHDTATFEMICRADTVGVFQIESRAQMSMLPRLQPVCFYDLVVEVAIVRPGPIQGGMVHPYLRRRQGLEPVTYPSPSVRKVLERTLGVPIFQEQVMAIAMVAAGFSAGQADGLRRAMAAWRRKGGLEPFQARLIDGLLANGYDQAFAQAIYRQIEGFAEYGFPESHAASFAWLAYVSAWLKCHEPEAFLTALLNSQPMGFYSPSQLIQDARRHAVRVLPVDVQISDVECSLERTFDEKIAVRLGLNQIKGLPEQAALRIVEARRQSGPFSAVQSLAMRAQLDRRALEDLASAGALAALAGHRRHAMWQIAEAPIRSDLLSQADVVQLTTQSKSNTSGTSGTIRSDSCIDTPTAISTPSAIDDLIADYVQLGYTLGSHPLTFLRKDLNALRYLQATALHHRWHGQLSRACGLVTMRQRPPTANGVMFLTLEDETGNVNVILYPALVEREKQTLLHARLLGVIGTWQAKDGTCHLLAGRVIDESARLRRLVQSQPLEPSELTSHAECLDLNSSKDESTEHAKNGARIEHPKKSEKNIQHSDVLRSFGNLRSPY